MMYLAFRYHNMRPSEFMSMGLGERQVVRAFIDYEMEMRKKEAEALDDGR